MLTHSLPFPRTRPLSVRYPPGHESTFQAVHLTRNFSVAAGLASRPAFFGCDDTNGAPLIVRFTVASSSTSSILAHALSTRIRSRSPTSPPSTATSPSPTSPSPSSMRQTRRRPHSSIRPSLPSPVGFPLPLARRAILSGQPAWRAPSPTASGPVGSSSEVESACLASRGASCSLLLMNFDADLFSPFRYCWKP